MFQNRDTIAAQATAAGEGGVAIVRVSGADCEAVLSRVFRAKNGKPLINRVLTYGYVTENGEIADEAMAVLMRAPHSYTREDVAEIHCHGSQALVRKILMLLMAAGARMAEPGEFTYRAFMNGRIDLAQAEGVMRMIRAGSERAMRSAVRQMEGGVSAFVRTARADITSLLATMAAAIDFTDEVEETGETFAENARIKAEAVMRATGLPAIADDSGLCVDALGGAPGVHSARYTGNHADSDKDRYELLLRNLGGRDERTARFVCSLCCAFPNGDLLTAEGACEGSILAAPRGENGFGYDPVFRPNGFDHSMAELTMEEKNEISHRGKALAQFKQKWEKYYDHQ